MTKQLIKRPLILYAIRELNDEVLYSAVVEIEVFIVLANYLSHLLIIKVHPPSKVMFATLKNAIASIKKVLLRYKGVDKIFTNKVNKIFDNVHKQVKT